MPLMSFPETIQLARSPRAYTCMPPSRARSRWPPRTIANESAESKIEAPVTAVTGALPRVDQVWVGLAGCRDRADAEDAVLAVQEHPCRAVPVTGNGGGQSDAEVDVHAVAQLARPAGDDPSSGRRDRVVTTGFLFSRASPITSPTMNLALPAPQ